MIKCYFSRMHQVLLVVPVLMVSQTLAYSNYPETSDCDSNNTYCPSPDGTVYDLYPEEGQYYDMCGLIEPGVACENVTTIPFPLAEIYRRGPSYTWILNDSPSNRQIDSLCTTLFPTGGVSYVAYNYITFCDGSTEITSTVATDLDVGVSTRGDGLFAVTLRYFAFINDRTRIVCQTRNFAESNGHEAGAISFGTIDTDEVQEIQDIIRSNCLAPDGLYMLPYRYPPQCVTEQICEQKTEHSQSYPIKSKKGYYK